MTVLVDIPRVDNAMELVGEFDTVAEAVEWIREHLGYCDDEGNMLLITVLDDEDEDLVVEGDDD